MRGGARAGGSDGGLAARCVVAIKARPTLASALCGGCYRLCLSARMSVSRVHLTQHNGRVEERGLAAGGLKACARVEHSHGVVAVHVRWGASSAQSWEGRRTSGGSRVRERPGSGLSSKRQRINCCSSGRGPTRARARRAGKAKAMTLKLLQTKDSARVDLAMGVQAGWWRLCGM